MRERPILFSAPMVRAILEGRKTQTRRIIRDDALAQCPYGTASDRLWVRETWYCDDFTAHDFEAARKGYVGAPPSDEKIIEQWRRALDYRADHDCNAYEAGCPCRDDSGRSSWRPSIHMPRWASRLSLIVESVRVERLNDISEADSIAEEIGTSGTLPPVRWRGAGESNHVTAKQAFVSLWNSINGHPAKRVAGDWHSNPWVWVVTFRREEQAS